MTSINSAAHRILEVAACAILSAGCPAPVDPELQSALRSAIQRNDPSEVRSLVRKGAQPGRPVTTIGTLPLDLAILNGKPEIVEILLEEGADPNAVSEMPEGFQAKLKESMKNMKGVAGSNILIAQPPLLLAAEGGNATIVSILLKHGANADIDVGGMTPLKAAELFGHKEVEKVLREAGATK